MCIRDSMLHVHEQTHRPLTEPYVFGTGTVTSVAPTVIQPDNDKRLASTGQMS